MYNFRPSKDDYNVRGRVSETGRFAGLQTAHAEADKQRGRKGTQNGIGRILGYQGLFLGRLPGDHFMAVQLVGCARGITMKGCIFSNETSKEKRYQKSKKN